MNSLKQTPLYPLHLEYAAKMTAFAGYQMPLHFAHGIIHEHLHCRTQTGFFDISHMGQAVIPGHSAAAELENLTLGGIADLKVGQQKYTLLTNPAGGVIDDLIVTRLASGLGLVVNAGCPVQNKFWRNMIPARNLNGLVYWSTPKSRSGTAVKFSLQISSR